MLHLLRTNLLIFLMICKDCIESGTMVIITRSHLSQLNIVHPSPVYTFGMSTPGVRHVDSCDAASPILLSPIGVSEH